jgi:hypothetical protein
MRVKLRVRFKQHLTAPPTMVCALIKYVPIFTRKCALGSLFSEYVIFLGREHLAPVGVVFTLIHPASLHWVK